MTYFLFVFSDELPVQLCLPSPLKDARTRQQLSSLALLGQGMLRNFVNEVWCNISVTMRIWEMAWGTFLVTKRC